MPLLPDPDGPAMDRQLAQGRELLRRLEAMAAEDLRLGFAANHVRTLVAEYRRSLRVMLDRGDA